ncbi:MAG: MBL fold metallo-hydrolase [Dongiaceae bacterium]
MTLRVTLLGTGCPVVDTERYGPALLVESDAAAILVDCGSGVTQRLLEHGTRGSEIDALLLTHLHSDHIVDLFQLIISSWHQGRERPLRVYGPKGTKRYVTGLLKLWKPEFKQRIKHERRPSTTGLDVDAIEIEAGPLLSIGPLSITTVEVDHRPVYPAFGFAFEAHGRRVVVSGDTTRCDSLTEAARDADLLVHEVFVHDELPVVGKLRTAATVRNVASYHTLSSEVGKIAAECRVGCLMLTHFVPPYADRPSLLSQVMADFAGPVILGEDLMSFDAVAGTVRHGQAHWSLGGPRWA